MLLPRILTAVVGIPLLIFLIAWGGLTYSFFIVGIALLALYEYGVILRIGKLPVQRVNAMISGGALALCLALGGPQGLVLSALCALIILREMFSREHSMQRVSFTLLGALWLGFMPAHLALIRDLRPHGERLTLMFFAAVWAMDCAAYAAGHVLGRHKLAEVLSPKKTWEGALAGFFAAVAVVLVFRSLSPSMLSWPRALAIGFIIGVAGQLSDLAESMLKRAVGVKDSSAILPGHGGIMDRFDSFILSAPMVYYFLALI